MADPTKYTPSYNFSDYQAQAPANPLPGQQVDIQLREIKTSLDSTVDAIKSVRRSDGALKNGVVTADSLASSLVIGFTLRGAWGAGVEYSGADGVVYDEIFYKARVAHTSTNENRPDLDADTWEFLTSLAAIGVTDGSVTPAKLSADAAGFRTKINAASVEQADWPANVHAADEKTTPADADEFGIWDSVSGLLRRMTWANIVARLAGLFARGVDVRPNIIVNGSMIDSQQNGNTLGTTNGYFAADQFGLYFTAATAAMSIQRVQSSKSLAGAANKLEFKTTTAKASLGSSDFVMISQPIEGSRPDFVAAGWGAAGAKQFVYRLEATLPAGLYHLHVQNSAGNRHIAIPFTVASGDANVAKVHELVIPGDTSGTWLTAAGAIGMVIDVVLAAGATLTGGTALTWGGTTYYAASAQKNILDNTANVARLTDVGCKIDPDAAGLYGAYQIGEVDPVYRPERYYAVFGASTSVADRIGAGTMANSSGLAEIPMTTACTMAKVPAMAQTGLNLYTSGSVAITSVSSFQVLPSAIMVRFTSVSTATNGSPVSLRVDSANGRLVASARLS